MASDEVGRTAGNEHSAHLIDQFWSPRLNFRVDRYGRARRSRTGNRHGRFMLFRIGDAVAHRSVRAAVFDARHLWVGI